MCRDDAGGSDGDGTAVPPLSCPCCGQPITGLTSTGPHTGAVEPCGCSIAPGLIHRESVHGADDDGE
ncbi:hypothetical protein [Natrinema salsiterrestre]|uniref:Small CPxCG-related zinc finger protein n=1 Tax=Natrinema salsiterrestre TaxID=2950540 RepID=A0A9Q4L5D9_9EURY|nr:hypothetical protein [Natrinema salsiterrestre]MDF9746255.1 hypothetical protein [Natrinema salsiterrestre]